MTHNLNPPPQEIKFRGKPPVINSFADVATYINLLIKTINALVDSETDVTSAVITLQQEINNLEPSPWSEAGNVVSLDNPNAVIDLNSTDRPTIPQAGMVIFNPGTTDLEWYDGTTWQSAAGSGTNFWERNGTTLSPLNAGDNVALDAGADFSIGNVTLTRPAASVLQINNDANTGAALRVGTATDISAPGDLVVGLTADNRMTYDQSAGTLTVRNAGGTQQVRLISTGSRNFRIMDATDDWFYHQQTASSNVAVLNLRDLGAGPGGQVELWHNTNGATPAAGNIIFHNLNGTAFYLWVDANGDLRFGTSAPTNANDMTGTVIS